MTCLNLSEQITVFVILDFPIHLLYCSTIDTKPLFHLLSKRQQCSSSIHFKQGCSERHVWQYVTPCSICLSGEWKSRVRLKDGVMVALSSGEAVGYTSYARRIRDTSKDKGKFSLMKHRDCARVSTSCLDVGNLTTSIRFRWYCSTRTANPNYWLLLLGYVGMSCPCM